MREAVAAVLFVFVVLLISVGVGAARRKAMKHLGLLHTPCDKCGGCMNVMSDPANRTTECESCFAERWVKEEMLKEFK